MRQLFLFIVALFITSTPNEGWELFQNVTFAPKYFEEADAYFEVPVFDDEIRAIEGREIKLTGYIIPFDTDSIFVLSAFPYSACFFCGGAGPESIAEVSLLKPQKELTLDAHVTVKGRLRLNDSDVDHMNFIIENAVFVEDEN